MTDQRTPEREIQFAIESIYMSYEEDIQEEDGIINRLDDGIEYQYPDGRHVRVTITVLENDIVDDGKGWSWEGNGPTTIGLSFGNATLQLDSEGRWTGNIIQRDPEPSYKISDDELTEFDGEISI